MPAIRPAAEPIKWRFSLKTLLPFLAIAAIAAWTIGWTHWNDDERVAFGLWFATTSAGIVFVRGYGRLGILIASAIGGLVPAFGLLTYYCIANVRAIEGIAFSQFALANPCATLIVGAVDRRDCSSSYSDTLLCVGRSSSLRL
jgi:hypothetical protein